MRTFYAQVRGAFQVVVTRPASFGFVNGHMHLAMKECPLLRSSIEMVPNEFECPYATVIRFRKLATGQQKPLSNSATFPPPWELSFTQGELRFHVVRAVTAHYHTHFQAVRRYAYTILRCSHDAEDIAQETFVRLIQTMERGAEPENPLPWLLRVAHNLAITRVSRRRPEDPLGSDEVESLADASPNPEQSLFASQRRRMVRRALARLSPQELRCWTLRAEGLRYREIAEVLEVRTGTVATLLVRAADKLSTAFPDGFEHSRAGEADPIV